MKSDNATGAETAVYPVGDLMRGKKGLVMGVANNHSIAWGIAQAVAAQGAELAFTYQGEAFERRVRPLAESIGSDFVMSADVADETSLDRTFAEIKSRWGRIDFLVHAIAYSDKNELKGRYLDTTRTNFLRTLDISCFSFVDVSRRAAEMMDNGGALLTLSYLGAERVVPNYNVMGIAKAALEASVRYIARDLGPRRIRVNAISAGPMRTLAGSAIGSARTMYSWNRQQSPMRAVVELQHVGGSALYLLSDLAGSVTGEIHYVDCGYNVIGVPDLAE